MRIVTLVGLLLFHSPSGFAECNLLDTNLLENASAELETGSCPNETPASVFGWDTVGGAASGRYSCIQRAQRAGDFIRLIFTGFCVIPRTGDRLFYGDDDSQEAMFQQTVPISPKCAAASLRFRLEGWLGGLSDAQDATVLSVAFEDASGRPLSLTVLGPVTPTMRSGRSGMWHFAAEGGLPKHTKRAVVVLRMARTGGTGISGFADLLSLRFDAPISVAPTTWSLAKRLYH